MGEKNNFKNFIDENLRRKNAKSWTLKIIGTVLLTLIFDALMISAIKTLAVQKEIIGSGSTAYSRIDSSSLLGIIFCVSFMVIVTIIAIAYVIHLSKNKSAYFGEKNMKETKNQNVFDNLTMSETVKPNEEIAPTVLQTPTAQKPINTGRSAVMANMVAEFNAKSQPVFLKDYDVKSLLSEFRAYVDRNGFAIEQSLAREILASVACSKLIVLNGNARMTKCLSRLVGGFFGSNTRFERALSSWNTSDNAMYNPIDNTETQFAVGTYASLYAPDCLNFTGLYNVQSQQFATIFKSLFPYIQAPLLPCPIRINYYNRMSGMKFVSGDKIVISPNTWFFALNAKDGDYTLPQVFVKYATVIEVPFEGGKNGENLIPYNGEVIEDVKLNVKDGNIISFKLFNEIVSEASKEHFISLDGWKKIDKLEAFLKVNTGFSMDNVTLRQIESYSSVLLAMGATEAEAIDSVVAWKILPQLGNLTRQNFRNSEATLSSTIDAIFGDVNVTKAHRVLHAIQLD